MLDIDRSPLYAVFYFIFFVVSVVRVGRRSYQRSVLLLTKYVHVSVFVVCCHIEATETSAADCGDYGVSSQSDLLSPVMKVCRGSQDQQLV
jgi:hypothetical protein